MFNSKQTKLFGDKENKTSVNDFVNAGMKVSARTLSGNGAKKYSSTDNPFVTQFGSIGLYRSPRSFEEISRDMWELYNENEVLSIRFVFFLRAITRKVMLPNGDVMETVTRGGGLKHEAIMRFMWLHQQDKRLFFDNLLLFISVGSWRDFFDMLRYDLEYHGWEGRVLDWSMMLDVLAFGLSNEKHSDLIKKYLPQITARSKCHTVREQANTIIAKWIASKFKLSYKDYRLLKNSGKAHEWQQQISQQLFAKINFNKIHGRALSKLVNGKFLANQGLEAKYLAWIEKQPVAKFTGFPHELFASGVPSQVYKRKTIDAQFMGLVQDAIDSTTINTTGLIVVRDTSGSMNSQADGTNMSSYNIAKALALYFSYFLKGHFENSWIEFNKQAKMHKWIGKTPTDRWENDRSSVIGNTDFQSVANLFVDIKKSGVMESDFPKGIICISDGEFDRTGNNKLTNFQTFKLTLLKAGFSEEFVRDFKIVLWDIPNDYYGQPDKFVNFETYSTQIENIFYMSGYNPANIAFLTGSAVVEGKVSTPQTAEELMLVALTQPIMEFIVM